MYQHRVDSGRGRAAPFQYNGQDGYVSDGRDHHQYTVEYNGDHVAVIELHLGRQL